MRVFSLLIAFLLIGGCSSSPSSAVGNSPSKYEAGLPATDMSSTAAGTAAATESDGSYSRQLSLEESVVESVQSMQSSISLADQAADTHAGRNADKGADENAGGEPLPDLILPDLANTYTLQLAALDSVESAITYARRYDIEPDQAGVARTHLDGYVWYILAYGIYATRADAELAKIELESMGVPEPWIRALSAIEKLSKEAVGFDL